MSRGHIRKRGKGSFQIVASGGFDPITGRRRQVFRTVHGSRRDAERELTALQAEVDTGLTSGGRGQDLASYLSQWLGSVSRTSSRGRPLAPTTLAKYQAAVDRISILIGSVKLGKLRSRHIEEMRDHLLDEGSLGPNSIADLMGILSQALKKAVSQGLLPRNWASRDLVTRPTRQTKVFRLIDVGLAREILDAVRDTRWEAPVHLVLGVTLRREEILGLRWRDVDFDEGTIHVQQAVTFANGEVHVGETKTSAGNRTISMPAFLASALKRARIQQNKRRLALGDVWVERDLVVDRGDGDYWKGPSQSTAWRRFARSIGLEDVPLLGLRHGSATLMLAAGVPDPVAAQIMGHSDTRVLRRYQDVVPDLRRQAAERMSDLLGT